MINKMKKQIQTNKLHLHKPERVLSVSEPFYLIIIIV